MLLKELSSDARIDISRAPGLFANQMLQFLAALLIFAHAHAHADPPALECLRSLGGIVPHDQSVLLERGSQRLLLVAITDKDLALVGSATDVTGIKDRAVASRTLRANDSFRRLVFGASTWIPRFLTHPVVYVWPVRPIARNLVAWMDSDPSEDFVLAVDKRLLPKLKKRLVRRLGFSEFRAEIQPRRPLDSAFLFP